MLAYVLLLLAVSEIINERRLSGFADGIEATTELAARLSDSRAAFDRLLEFDPERVGAAPPRPGDLDLATRSLTLAPALSN